MGLGKTYSTKYLVDSNGNTGAANQVLVSTATGIDWVDGSGSVIIGGPYLPLTAGSGYPLTGDLHLSTGLIKLASQITTKIELVANQMTLYAGGLQVFTGYNASSDGVEIGNATGDMDIKLSGGANNKVLFLEGSSGNVGIGTTSPAAKLHVEGGIKVGSDAGTNLDFANAGIIVRGSAAGNNSYIVLEQQAVANWRVLNRATSGNFEIASGSSAGQERLTITTAGNVGIGTTSPSEKLHVSGNGLITGTLEVDTVNNGAGDFLTRTSGGIVTRRTADEVRSDIQASQYFKVSSGSWVAASTSGWFRLASTSGNQRGSVRVILSFIGGNFAPQNYIIDVTKDWTTSASLRVDVRTAQIRWITGVRVIQDTVNTSVYHLEANFASSSSPYEFHLTFDNAYGFNSTWTMATTAPLVASTNGTVILSKDIFLSGNYSTDLINTGNINISGNTLSSIDTNGNIILSPNGSGNVGIGTTSPTSLLHLSSSSGTPQGITIQGGDETFVKFIHGPGGVKNWGLITTNLAASDFGIYQSTSAGGDPFSAGTPRLYFNASGNVGIGTTGPGNKLHVVGSATVSTSILVPGASTANALMHRFGTGGGSGSYTTLDVIKTADTSGDFVFMAYAAGVAASTSSPKLIFGHYDATPSNGAVMTIDTSNERVGIGTTAPTYKLSVQSTDTAGATGTGATLQLLSDTTAVANKGGSVIFGDAGNAIRAMIKGMYIGPAGSGGGLAFSTAEDSGGAITERMRLNSTGNVGIGTTNPVGNANANARVLQVNGGGANPPEIKAGGDNAEISIAGGSSASYLWATGNYPLVIATNASEKMRITSAGNVGIGTTNPSGKLHVDSGDIVLNNTYSLYLNSSISDGNWRVQRSSAPNITRSLVSGASLNLYSHFGTGEGFVIGANGGNSYYEILGSGPTHFFRGNVGIGTASPAAKLSVELSGAANQRLANFRNTGGNSFIEIQSSGNGAIGFWTAANNAFSIYQNATAGTIGTSVLYVDASANVGIGTTAPDSKFHVEDTNPEVRITGTGGTSFPRILWEYPVSATQASRWALTSSASGNTFYLYNYTQSKKVFQVDGTASHITLNHDAAGTTQIGTSTTQTAYQLYVATNVGQTGAIEASGSVKITSGALGVNIAASATAGRIDASNDIVAYSTSDKRLKENIKPIENALDKVKSLTGVEFDWIEETKHVHGYEGHDVGVIAQEVQEVLPEAIRTNDSGYLSVRYEKLIGLLIESNKELAARIEILEQKLKQ